MADLIDEFMTARKDYVKSGSVLMKAARAPTSWNAEKRTGRFVMSTEQEDRDRDIVVQAGLDTDEFMKNPVAPFSHRSHDFPIGSWGNVEKLLTGRPKRTEGDLILLPEGKDEVADRLAAHIEAGTVRACSIGFIPKSVERREVPEDKRDTWFWPGFMIHEAELVECSPCSIPANPGALAKAAADGDVHAREILEEVLDNWAKHPETGLLIPRSEFEAGWKTVTSNKTTVVVSSPADDIEEPPPHEPEAAGLFDQIKAFMAKALGKSVEEIEAPEPQPEPEAPTPADPAAKEAAAARAAALEERLTAKFAA